MFHLANVVDGIIGCFSIADGLHHNVKSVRVIRLDFLPLRSGVIPIQLVLGLGLIISSTTATRFYSDMRCNSTPGRENVSISLLIGVKDREMHLIQ